MDSENGGQSSSELQRQTAAAIARRKVLAAYAESAQKALLESRKEEAHLKNEPISPKINSESWRKYHSAWQDYYQKYYSDYYSRAAQDYIAKERLKDAREKDEEEEILNSLSLLNKKEDGKAGLRLHPDKENQTTTEEPVDDSQ